MIDTNNITNAYTGEMGKLPTDKKLHVSASYGLCLRSEPLDKLANSDDLLSSVSLIKTSVEVFGIGLSKEYQDAGKDFSANRERFKQITGLLGEVHADYLSNGISGERHETDLLADVIGANLFTTNMAFNNLRFLIYKE